MIRALIAALILCLLTAGAALAGADEATFPVHQVTPPGAKYRPSASCKACHPAIHAEWAASTHHRAGLARGRLFAAVWQKFAAVLKAQTGAAPFFCGLCHVPSAPDLADLVSGVKAPSPQDPIQDEGIGCHFCHSITGLKRTEAVSLYTVEVSRAMRGPHEDSRPQGHQAVYSPMHATSQVCAGCHGYLHFNGVGVCTVQEEMASVEEGCQECHMPRVMGPPARQSPERASHRSHRFPGVYDPAMLARAAKMSLSAQRGEGGVTVTAEIANQTPHRLPSTQPLRWVVLALSAQDASGQVVWRNFNESPLQDPQALLAKLFGAGEKVPVPTWLARRVARDTRLGSYETRRLTWEIPAAVAAAGDLTIEARLLYWLAPPKLIKALGFSDDPYRGRPHLLAQASAQVP